MESNRLKLPIGIQTFETIRTEGYLYVDKTKHLINMIDTGQIYFLARPRRFGKSLTLSTFDALFSGKKELFKGLYAEEYVNRPHYQSYPVIRLDMSDITTNKGIEVFESALSQMTIEIAEKMGVDVPIHQPSGEILRNLIANTARKEQKKVVILVDEYDKPYTDFVNDPIMAEKVRDVLRNYYIRIKSNDQHIRFTFITGISKFAKFGVFSTLNTPLDISMTPKYADICGYTEEEVIHYFPDYLVETANEMEITATELIERMRHYYNGFSFDSGAKAKLYNPFSTLLFFENKEFFNYWIDSGKPKLIADYLKNRYLTVEQFRNLPISKDFAKSPGDMDTTTPEGFLYQSGYLTLRPGKIYDLSLDYPNTEVLNSMSALATQNMLTYKDESFNQCQTDLLNGLINKNKEKVIGAFNRLLASIPYEDFTAAAKQSISTHDYEMKPQEWLYRASIFAFLHGCGVVVAAEMHTNKGRPDLVISYRGNVWVIEIKVAFKGESADQKAKEASRQIIDKNYAAPYPNSVCLGLGIDDTLRQITHIC